MSFYSIREKNLLKSFILLLFFFSLVVFVGWYLSVYTEQEYFFWLAFILSVLGSFGTWWFSDRIVLWQTGAKPLSQQEYPEVFSMVENLAKVAGLPRPRLYIIETPAMNAFAVGPTPSRSAVVFTRGLLEKLERSELEGVIGHELAHIFHRDTLVMTISVVLLGTLLRLWEWFVRGFFWVDSEGERRDRSSALFLIGLALLVLAPLLAYLIHFAISRKREFMADSQSVLWTRYPKGLIRALEKIAGGEHNLKTGNSLVSALLIHSSPRKAKRSFFQKISNLFSTHPPVEERIRALSILEV